MIRFEVNVAVPTEFEVMDNIMVIIPHVMFDNSNTQLKISKCSPPCLRPTIELNMTENNKVGSNRRKNKSQSTCTKNNVPRE